MLFFGISGGGNSSARNGGQLRGLTPVLTAARSTSEDASAGSLRVLTEPEAGLEPIYRLIVGARSSAADLTMYELADYTAEADLAADADRGVDVRVILDQHFERSANQGAFDYLAAHGVHVRWGPADTTFHQKTLTVDGATSVIMTLNLVARYYRGTRDFAVIDTDRADVSAIADTFNADFSGRSMTPMAQIWCGPQRTLRHRSCRSSTTPPTPLPWKTRKWMTRLSPAPWPPLHGVGWTSRSL